MSSHKTFTSAYEMRVAELEAENGELHGFMSALLNDPTSGMLKAVMGFYRQRYFEGDEFKGATVQREIDDGTASEVSATPSAPPTPLGLLRETSKGDESSAVNGRGGPR